jgi:hypothetical protein
VLVREITERQRKRQETQKEGGFDEQVFRVLVWGESSRKLKMTVI